MVLLDELDLVQSLIELFVGVFTLYIKIEPERTRKQDRVLGDNPEFGADLAERNIGDIWAINMGAISG